MNSIEAIFVAVGKSSDVPKLADQLSGELQQRLEIGNHSSVSGSPAATNSIIVKLPFTTKNDDSIFAETEEWLKHHETIIKSTDAQKVIEFHTFLDANTGSRTLTLPNSIVRMCGELGLDVANQAIRVLSKAELDQIQSTQN